MLKITTTGNVKDKGELTLDFNGGRLNCIRDSNNKPLFCPADPIRDEKEYTYKNLKDQANCICLAKFIECLPNIYGDKGHRNYGDKKGEKLSKEPPEKQ